MQKEDVLLKEDRRPSYGTGRRDILYAWILAIGCFVALMTFSTLQELLSGSRLAADGQCTVGRESCRAVAEDVPVSRPVTRTSTPRASDRFADSAGHE